MELKDHGVYMTNRFAVFATTAAILCLLITVQPARADLQFSVPSFNVSPGSSGAFDVTLTNTGLTAVQIGGFSFDLLTTSPPITFTDATTGTSIAYIFVGNSLFGPDIVLTTGAELVASDNVYTPASYYSLAGGATVGLGHVTYFVASDAQPGPFDITFTSLGSGTSLSDSGGGNLPVTVVEGQVQVPEADALSTLATLLGAAGLILSRKGRPAKRKSSIA
jgi:hypothetical protein